MRTDRSGADSYCFVCGRRVTERPVEKQIPNETGCWIFLFHDHCLPDMERTIPRRFHDMALRALGHPQVH